MKSHAIKVLWVIAFLGFSGSVFPTLMTLEADTRVGEVMDLEAVDLLFEQTGEHSADLKAIIRNSGKAQVKQLEYTLSINGEKEGGSFPIWLQPGGRMEVPLSHAVSNYFVFSGKKAVSDLEVIFVVDPDDLIAEGDELNNTIKDMFSMRESF